jgi:hypothetical protein
MNSKFEERDNIQDKKAEVSLEIQNVQNLVHTYNVLPGNFFNLLKYDGSS